MTDLEGFSKRVVEDPRFRVHPADPMQTDPVVVAIKDQLLVDDSVVRRVRGLLPAGHRLDRIGKLLGGPPALDRPPGVDCTDVGIYDVVFPADAELDIFELTTRLREGLTKHGGAQAGIGRKVSPNHVLVPAMEGHSCPWGPPTPIEDTPRLPDPDRPQVRVTVIDSGYQWLDDVWRANPLDPFLAAVQPPAEYISTQEPRQLGRGWTAGVSENVLTAAIKNPPDGPAVIYALAGHANFIAGVIAQRCPQAGITIVNHNGTFDPAVDDVPTEASVARSLCRSTQRVVPDLIDLGFAFRCFDDVISVVWDVAFEFMGRGTIGNGPLVACPAGNQSSKDWRYPAALRAFDSDKFRNVIAVASASRDGQSAFSNYGEWITCSADGHDVNSTFLPVSDMPVEDDPHGAARNFANGWARWNGTSFATPKIVAEIAKRMPANGNSAMLAWQALQNAYPNALRDRGVGIEFPF